MKYGEALMTDMTAITAAFQALSGAKILAEGLLSARDISLVSAKVAELNSKIIDAQNGIFAALEERSALVSRIGELEKKIADFETWQHEKNRYELIDLGGQGRGSVLAYALKKEAQGTEPFHLLCTKCYQHRIKSPLQATTEIRRAKRVHFCPECKTEFAFN
jgi:hypothetical protein